MLGAQVASSRGSMRALQSSRAMQPCRVARVCVSAADERYRLHNLSPQEGSRRDNKRKGRGYGGHQGGTCGFGTRGQKSRSGSGTRPGFEGGQTPLYRRLPKLRGIAGGMSAGLPKYVVVNLEDLERSFEAGSTVDLAAIEAKGLLHLHGREAKLPLKVLGNGELSKPLTIKAASFSTTAKEKVAAIGGACDELPRKPKWTRKAHEARVRKMTAEGLDPKKEAAKKKAAAAKAKAKAT